MKIISAEQVGNRLNDWRIAIRKHDVHNAKTIYTELKELLQEMEENQEVLTYYSLLEGKFKLMLYERRGKKLNEPTVLEYPSKTNDLIEYYFYLYKALYASYNRDYASAIGLFKIAEKKLQNIPDEIEVAEFHTKVANLYMLLRQSLISLHYIQNAIDIFKGHDGYERRLAAAFVIAATNFMDIGDFKRAENYYTKALHISNQLNDHFLASQLYHNISILYAEVGESKKCIDALEKALSDDDYLSSCYFEHSMFMLLKELLSIDEKSQALYYFELVKQKQEIDRNPIYTAKMNFLYHLYFTEDISKKAQTCFDDISILKELKDVEGARELSALAAKHFEELGSIHQAYLFLKDAYQLEHTTLNWRNYDEKSEFTHFRFSHRCFRTNGVLQFVK
ncbi:tetratricopeptide repeat protein [Bacillus altitudinis]|uniref:response regulator aspartate phosphatase n=1 Tax=Bacillus altitudinis TaxID=293387 RepID=UPI00227E5DFA|nr:tetratricopeptide repeat protein [Bacillus altitudinis]MCY7450612.1 tetratricopeptide repeat protein [Bacillus altitudinis]